jgi:hypothetical protein
MLLITSTGTTAPFSAMSGTLRIRSLLSAGVAAPMPFQCGRHILGFEGGLVPVGGQYLGRAQGAGGDQAGQQTAGGGAFENRSAGGIHEFPLSWCGVFDLSIYIFEARCCIVPSFVLFGKSP